MFCGEKTNLKKENLISDKSVQLRFYIPSRPWAVIGQIFQSAFYSDIRNKKVCKVKNFQV